MFYLLGAAETPEKIKIAIATRYIIIVAKFVAKNV